MLVLAASLSLLQRAEAQRAVPQPRYRPYHNPSQGAEYTPRTAARSRARSAERAPAQPKAGDIVKQEITSTIISQVVLGGLEQPVAVAIQPKTNKVFVAEAGKGRIARLNDVPNKYELLSVIDGFEPAAEGASAGLQSIAFLDKYNLVVANRNASEQTLVDVYHLLPAGKIEAADVRSHLELASDGQPLVAEQIGLALINQKLFVAGRGVERGFLAEIESPGDEQTACHLITNRAGEVDSPTAVAAASRQLWIANVGSPGEQADSTLSIYDPASGKTTATIVTGLRDMVGLAVSPRSGRLYAVDRAASGTEQGGLYRLDVSEDEGELVCNPAKLMTLDQPTALAFTPDGELFIVTLASHTNEHKGGLLVRIYNESQL
jgi:DNA-binding beta-propeller fold protein YncE